MQNKILWTPYPYKAGFTITDDTDAATLEQVKIVYDFLLSKNVRVTKTVWSFKPSDNCGIPAIPDSALRGITLENPEYRTYCLKLADAGFEISLHGASAGNNLREQTLAAINMLKAVGIKSSTFICHSKNADNIYWEEKATNIFPFNLLLKLYSKNRCSGEDKQSPYFWGDICRQHISQIRLMRTRNVNTLKINPSMPYYEPEKPYVNGWFSATKRSLKDCANQQNLAILKQENGLTVLYQYLHRYVDPQTLQLQPGFIQSIENLTSDKEIYLAPVNTMMERLRDIQGIFLIYAPNEFSLINTNSHDVSGFQIQTQQASIISSLNPEIMAAEERIVFPLLRAESISKFKSKSGISFFGRNIIKTSGSGKVILKVGIARLFINLSEKVWKPTESITLPPNSFKLLAQYSGTGFPLLSVISYYENFRLIMHQIHIIISELLFKKRSLNTEKYLNTASEIYLENQDNW